MAAAERVNAWIGCRIARIVRQASQAPTRPAAARASTEANETVPGGARAWRLACSMLSWFEPQDVVGRYP